MDRKNDITNNFIWRFLERIAAQGVTFIVSIILARILGPNAYGTIALVNIFILIFGIFIDVGFSSALIQKKDVDDLDYSSVFYVNLFLCFISYILIYFLSPFISNFYNNQLLLPVIRVAGLAILISSFKNIQITYVSKNLLFKKYFFVTIIGTIISAFVGISMAYNGYGVWSLVFQDLTNNVVDTILLWLIVKWRPKLIFSLSRLKELFNYGWKIFVSSLVSIIWDQSRQLIIGKKYTTNDLAYYNKGIHFPEVTTTSILTSIDSVLLPTMSKLQNDLRSLKDTTRKSIKVGSYVLWPMMIGLAICSDNFVRVFLNEEWFPTIPYIRIFCITYAFYPIHTSNLNAIKAIGRSDIFLKLEIEKKIVGLIIILVSMRYGVYVMALSTILSSIFSQLINSWPNRKLLNYSYIDQIKDLLPAAIMSLIMGLVVYSVNFIGLNYVVTLIIQVIIGIITYILISKITKNDSYLFCKSKLLSLIRK